MQATIRRATPADAAIIAAYNAALAAETEQLELNGDRLLQGVKVVLQDPAKGFYTLAEVEHTVVGQMLVTMEWSDWRNGVFWWIQSVYVSPQHRRRGIFKRLYEHILQEAKALGTVCGLRVYVEKTNVTAQKTYQRHGLQKTGYDMYEVDFVLQRREN
jgi:ribosomal protein S18 acetylase RimI-like enzyme